MDSDLASPHLTIYYDRECAERDSGRGWCLETSDSEITERFGTFLEATMFAARYTGWLMGISRQEQSR